MDRVFGVNKFNLERLSLQKDLSFFKVKVPPESNLGLAVHGIKFCELKMLGKERKCFFTLFQASFKNSIQIIADSDGSPIFSNHSPIQTDKP
ncbi:hypothetical protein SDC9_118398 [bioreactor metagenome]|uniref:Uncharacterized protein n=1 Tax=bioreactor metagenome TaxID=1076179 RepID=A0A645C7S6_9ZZZZ